MKRYKKWMAALLTGILVVTGSMSPALAAELPTEAEELVSAAEFSDEIVTNEAEIPDVSEIEEDEVAARESAKLFYFVKDNQERIKNNLTFA